MPDARQWCRSCSEDLPNTARKQKYCSNACRQRAYRQRQQIGNPVLAATALAELLSPQQIENWPPEVRDFMRKVLKRALRTLCPDTEIRPVSAPRRR